MRKEIETSQKLVEHTDEFHGNGQLENEKYVRRYPKDLV